MKKITASTLLLLTSAVQSAPLTIQDLVPNTSLSTETTPVRPDTEVINMLDIISRPFMGGEPAPTFPDIYPAHFTLAQRQQLHEAQLAYKMKLGEIKPQPIRNLHTPRFAPGTSEIDIYKLTIIFHNRAIQDNLPLSAYVDWINQGHPRSKEWIRDATYCGTGFLLYPEDNNLEKCSKSPSWLEAERSHDAAGDTVDALNIRMKYFEDQWVAAKETIAQLKAKLAKKGKR